MTPLQIFKRFLKDNDLYVYTFYGKCKNSHRLRFRNEECFRKYYGNTPLSELFKTAFSWDPMFNGMAQSPQRKRYYALCKKWKYMVTHHVFLQTNIEPGDTVFSKEKRNYTVKELRGRCIYCRTVLPPQYSLGKQFFSFDGIKGKEMINNLYYKDNKGRCYGKIDGEFNEIQLQ